mmetsp:Transcript_494/g.455  ORF Transcript_494/g.455 Transcript_494/m.455 type:complete len:179 (+) Transcript_494:412-948(+)
MGRYAGFIALNASLANRDVNICLVPEFKFELNGPHGLLEYIVRRLKLRSHCIIVVAEGAATAILDGDVGTSGKDQSGNVINNDVGIYLKDKIGEFCKERKVPVSFKYIDPTYMIRSIPANSFDKQVCSSLAQNVVHGVMAGWTGFTIGTINNKTAFIPLSEIAHPKNPIQIQPNDRRW